MSAGSLTSPVYDFTSLDYQSANLDLIRFSQATFPEELWTDYNQSNFATDFIGTLAYSTDLLAYNANAQNLETIPVTIRLEQNFRNVAKTYDYELKSAAPSKGFERCTLDPVGDYPFVISAHLQFTSKDNVVFQPDADVGVGSYPAEGYVDVSITQGAESFEETIGITNGSASQPFQLRVPFLIDGTLQVSVGLDGYDRVTNFISVGSTSKSYVVQTDQNGVTTIIMGDSINGVIPAKGLTVLATYKTGGGLTTNLAANTINRIASTSDGSSIPPQILSATNIVGVTNGAPKQSLDNAKQNMPLTFKANDRAINEQDFGALIVALVPGVLKATVITGAPYGGSYPALAFVVPNGGGDPSDSLKNVVISRMKSKRLLGKRIRVFAPVYVDVVIESDTYVLQNSPALQVRSAQREILLNMFDPEIADFGQTYSLQSVYDATLPTKLSGSQRVFYKTFSVRPYFARHVDRPTTGNGTIESITVDLDKVRRREWLVRILPPQPPLACPRYSVTQRRLGTVTTVTDTLVTDEVSSYKDNELSTQGWSFRVRPSEVSLPSFNITGNTSNSITTDPGLLLYAEPDDDYVLEKQDPSIGKLLEAIVAPGSFTSGTQTIDTINGTSWEVGDSFTSVNNPGVVFLLNDVNVNQFTFTPMGIFTAGESLRYCWTSADESVSFSVAQGSTPFVAGDELYVDTFDRAGDLALRPQNFPLLAEADLTVNPVGGVK